MPWSCSVRPGRAPDCPTMCSAARAIDAIDDSLFGRKTPNDGQSIFECAAIDGNAQSLGGVMTRVRVGGFTVSLDGFGAGPEQSLENPLGKGGQALHPWLVR